MLIAFYFNDFSNLLNTQYYYEAVSGALMELLHEDVYDANLAVSWNRARIPYSRRSLLLATLSSTTPEEPSYLLCISVLYPSNCTHFCLQFKRFGFRDVLVWISLVFSTAFIVYGMLVQLAVKRNTNFYPSVSTAVEELLAA